MADRPISDLTPAAQVKTEDLFALEQDGTAKRLSGAVLIAYLLARIDGHGGITGITWTDSGTSGDGQTHTGTISYADGSVSTITFRDGVKGDKGDADRVHIKYASDLPTKDADMHNTPDNYIGVYSGPATAAPTAYTAYSWFEIKGAKGNTGDAARLLSPTVTYMVSENGQTPPDGNWSSSIPVLPLGSYLWTRIRLPFNDGNTVVAYSVSRNGIDGQGAVSSVNDVGPTGTGNVSIGAAQIPAADGKTVQKHLDDAEEVIAQLAKYPGKHFSVLLSSLPTQIDDEFITEDMRVFNPVFSNLAALTSEPSFVTGTTKITIQGTMSGTTQLDFDLQKVD